MVIQITLMYHFLTTMNAETKKVLILDDDRILAQFEDFCVVTQSVRESIPVSVRVLDVTGALLHHSGEAAPA